MTSSVLSKLRHGAVVSYNLSQMTYKGPYFDALFRCTKVPQNLIISSNNVIHLSISFKSLSRQSNIFYVYTKLPLNTHHNRQEDQ